MDFSYPDEDILGVIEPTHVEIPDTTEREKIEYALPDRYLRVEIVKVSEDETDHRGITITLMENL